MSNIDHNITFVNSSLKVTASSSLNIENDLKANDNEQPLDSLIQSLENSHIPHEKDQKIAQENI